jgi:hypothetical protein
MLTGTRCGKERSALAHTGYSVPVVEKVMAATICYAQSGRGHAAASLGSGFHSPRRKVPVSGS